VRLLGGLFLAATFAGCSDAPVGPVGDAPLARIDAPLALIDARTDAAPAVVDAGVDAPTCQSRTLLTGGSDVMPQGWSVVSQMPATLSYGPDYVRLETSTTSGAVTSGQLLLEYPGALDGHAPFTIEVVMLVESTSRHNPSDSAAAILGSFTPIFGNAAQRMEMIYLDPDAIGWADDSQSFAVDVTDNGYHTYRLAVDAAGEAHVSVDGTPALSRSGFTSNGAIAIGDQTNDANVDSALRIRSVTALCP